MRAVHPPAGDRRAPWVDAGARPPELGPGQALLKPLRIGLRPADVAIARGELKCSAAVMGGQAVGVVERIEAAGGAGGRSAGRVAVGSRVVIADSIPCAVCDLCRRGLAAHCPDRGVMGVSRDGALAEQVVAPVSSLVVLPASVGDDEAVFALPLAAALHVADQVRVSGAAYVTVLGDGVLALLCAQVLARRNASVRLLSSRADRLELCEKWGVKRRRIEEVGLRRDQDVVVVADQAAGGVGAAMGLVTPRGEVVVAGGDGARWRPETVDLAALVAEEVRVQGSRSAPLGDAVELLGRQGVELLGLVTARFDLGDAPKALVEAADPAQLQVVVSVR